MTSCRAKTQVTVWRRAFADGDVDAASPLRGRENRTRAVVRPLTAFASPVERVSRGGAGLADVYGTGKQRAKFFYPAFGVYKYMCRGCHGDLLGHKNLTVPEQTLDYGRRRLQRSSRRRKAGWPRKRDRDRGLRRT